MPKLNSVTGVLLDEAALDLEEMARACGVEPDWIRRHVQAGVLLLEDRESGEGANAAQTQLEIVRWRFRSRELNRARRLAAIERDFDANEELAALVVDLADEVR